MYKRQEWKNIDLIKVVIKTVDRLLGRPEGTSEKLITYVTDRAGHDLRYAIDSVSYTHLRPAARLRAQL